jgi:hypothetical protein
MRSDAWINQLAANCSKSLQSAALVCPDQPRVADHISGEDGGETAGLAHFSSPAAKRKPDASSSRCSGLRKGLTVG